MRRSDGKVRFTTENTRQTVQNASFFCILDSKSQLFHKIFDEIIKYAYEKNISFYQACLDADNVPGLAKSSSKIKSRENGNYHIGYESDQYIRIVGGRRYGGCELQGKGKNMGIKHEGK